LAHQEDSGWREEEWINGVKVVDGVKPLEEDGASCYHLLTKFQLFT
jgi:hypothetical protein